MRKLASIILLASVVLAGCSRNISQHVSRRTIVGALQNALHIMDPASIEHSRVTFNMASMKLKVLSAYQTSTGYRFVMQQSNGGEVLDWTLKSYPDHSGDLSVWQNASWRKYAARVLSSNVTRAKSGLPPVGDPRIAAEMWTPLQGGNVSALIRIKADRAIEVDPVRWTG